MNKSELIEAISKEVKGTKAEAERHLNAMIETVKTSLKKGKDVNLIGFGKFDVIKRKARNGINPQTKEKIKIAASKSPVFKAGKAFKDLVNNKKS
jgi:DNA-binding protein HU-beta